MRRFAAVIALIASAGLFSAAKAATYDPNQILIMPVTAAMETKGWWTPSANQVREAYDALATGLAKGDISDEGPMAGPSDHQKLAMGLATWKLRVRGGTTVATQLAPATRFIWIEGICPAKKADAFGDSAILHGGTCVFNAMYDPAQRKVVRFAFNGV